MYAEPRGRARGVPQRPLREDRCSRSAKDAELDERPDEDSETVVAEIDGRSMAWYPMGLAFLAARCRGTGRLPVILTQRHSNTTQSLLGKLGTSLWASR